MKMCIVKQMNKEIDTKNTQRKKKEMEPAKEQY